LMTEYSQRCQPPWSEREIAHKVASAAARVDPAKLGRMVRKGVRYAARSKVLEVLQQHVAPKPKATTVRYEVSDALELPDAIKDGCRQFLASVFAEGEGIRIAVARTGDDSRELPKDSGLVLSREEWLRKLDQHDGNPNGFLKTSDKNGIFVSVNPMKIGGSKDSDVTAWRHALLEFDNISQVEQWGIIQASRIPCAAVISSGGKSVHAWVKVNASSRPEFDERVKMLYQHFSEYQPDEKNKNPSRFSRLPNCERGKSRQELLSLSCGCESFTEWMETVQADSRGETITMDDLDNYDPVADNSMLLGNDWLCKSEPMILNGSSGIGKSSLAYQMALAWSVGLPIFGIKPVRPLKVVIIQAENSKRYLKKVTAGIRAGLGIKPENTELWDLHRKNFTFVYDATHTKLAFVDNFRKEMDRKKPDLALVDPLLAYCPEIAKIEACSQFCREWMQPVLNSTGVAAFFIHHTGKTSTDPKSRKSWNLTDYSYAGYGSSDLPNWLRSSMTLEQCEPGVFKLMFTKRSNEASATHPSGEPTQIVWLRHAAKGEGIFWQQIDAPERPEKDGEKAKKGAPNKVEKVMALGLGKVIDSLKSPLSKNELAVKIMDFSTSKRVEIGLTKCKEIVDKLFENGALDKTPEGYKKA
jgi:RecA-family ATPase